MRLKGRTVSLRDPSYLVHRYLWRNLETAVLRAMSDLPSNAKLVLDIGCGHKPYADLFSDSVYIGLNNNADDAAPDIVGSAISLPIASGTFDLVFCTQVLEHVPHPWSVLHESFRVLRRGGWIVLSAPFYWPLHEEPHDYFRFTRYGLTRLLEDAGFTQIELRADGGDYARLCLSILHSLPGWLSAPLRMPLNGLGAALDKVAYKAILPANYTVLARAGDVQP